MTKAAVATLSLVVFGIFGLGSCASMHQVPSSPASGQFALTPEAGPFTVIGYLEHRDRIITIKSGTEGTVYSARSKDGKTLFENLSAEQLKEQSPEVHDFIEAATAGSASVMIVPRPPVLRTK